MRHLLLSTIIATGAVATTASALDVDVNGYARFAIMGNTMDGQESMQTQKDWEFEFKGKEEFDNGITAFIDLEVDTNVGADEIRTDDVTFGLSGSFGAVTVGNFDNRKVKAGLGLVPVMGSAYGFGSLEAGDNQWHLGLWTPGITSIGNYADAPSIAYTSPSISGFTIGGQYTSFDGDGQTTLSEEDAQDTAYSIGAGYAGEFGGAKVDVGIAYYDMTLSATAASTTWSINQTTGVTESTTTAAVAEGDDTSIAGGIKISMSGVTVGISHRNGERRDTDYDLTNMGVMYATGPFAVSAGYAMGDDLGDDYKAYDLGASYKIGPSAKVMAGMTSGENDGVDGGSSNTIYGAGIQINF